MQKIITPFLLCTLLCLSFSSPIDPKKRNIPFALLSQYASSSGEVPLVLGDLGFTVHVDFSNYKDKVAAVKADASDYGNMAIALYTDETFFGTACEGFQSYCDKHPEVCQKTGAAGHSVFPYLETDSVSIQPEVYLDYNHWLLQSDAQLGTQCNQQYSVDAYGLLGMGFTEKSLPNFVGDTPSFAIHVAKNLSNGSFAFHSDMTKAKSETPAATLTTDNVWHVAKVDTVKIRGRSLDTTASMIFDLGSDSIGLPKDIFNHVLDAIAGSPSVGNCTIGDDFRPVCGYTGDIRRLSSLKIIIGDQTIDIPPEVYIVSTQNSTFYYDKIMLKIKKLSVDGSNDGLNVTKAYQNYIILGFPVLSYYYSVFQAGSAGQGTITLYYSGDYISASEMTWIFVVVGVAGILVIGVCYFLYERKYRKDKELTQPLFDDAVKINAGRGKRVYDTKA